MLKRVTYLWRRADLTPAEFRAHWRDPHGPIAANLRAMIAYNQNDVLARIWSNDHEYPEPDGIVELWFDDTVESPGTDPEVMPLLRADEPNFMSGFTGYELRSNEVPAQHESKVWIRGRWRNDAEDTAALERVAAALGAVVGDTKPQINVIAPSTNLFVREFLNQQPNPPRVLIILNAAMPLTTKHLQVLEEIARGPESPIVNSDALITKEVRITDATRAHTTLSRD